MTDTSLKSRRSKAQSKRMMNGVPLAMGANQAGPADGAGGTGGRCPPAPARACPPARRAYLVSRMASISFLSYFL